MDNLTHSMLGAVLGQTGLKRKTGLGMPALIIGANIPDIDATCTFLGTQSLAMRRGLTHGPLAMLILPLILTALLLLYDRWQTRRGSRPESRPAVQPGWLLALAFIGTLSHPAMDWMNSYGIRLLEPFSHQWFYGDVLFIIDILLWAMLIGGFLWSRRAEKRGSASWQRRGIVTFTSVCAYIFVNGAITGLAEARATRWVESHTYTHPAAIVANPEPFAFWRRDMLWRTRDGQYGHYPFSIFAPDAVPANGPEGKRIGIDNPELWRQAMTDADARAFLFWSRMPLATVAPDGSLTLTDQRFSAISRGSFTVVVPPAAP